MPRFRPGDRYAGLDLAKSSGVCVGIPFERPHAETWDLGDGIRSDKFVMLKARLIPFLMKWRPVLVFIEEPMKAQVMVRVGSTIETQIQLTGLVAVAEMVCNQEGIPTKLVNREDALGHFTGIRRYHEKDDGKRACVVRCRQMGWPIEGFDQADAVAVWDRGCAHEFPRDYALHGVGRPLAKRIEDNGQQGSRNLKRGAGKAPRRGKRNPLKRLPLFTK